MIKLTFKPNKAGNFKVPAEGYHVGFIVGYMKPFEAETMKGEKYTASKFMIEMDEYTDDGKKRLVCLSKTVRLDSLHPKSNLFALACAALKKKEVSPVDVPTLDALLYKHIGIIVEHNEKDGKTYANTKSICSIKTDPKDWVSTYEPWESDGVEDSGPPKTAEATAPVAAAQTTPADDKKARDEAEFERILASRNVDEAKKDAEVTQAVGEFFKG